MRRPAETMVAFLLLCGFFAGALAVRARLPVARGNALVLVESDLPVERKPEDPLLVRPGR
jgi:hypothetical protein